MQFLAWRPANTRSPCRPPDSPPFTSPPVRIAAGQTQHLDVSLTIQMEQQQVQVSGDTPGVSVDPDNNVSAVVLTGKDLDALSDDPDELSNELTALAGPAAGPSGGQIYIDGFTGGQLPPKSAIRAIIINQNPFSAQYDSPGYGRIEILTKPGTDKLHGQLFMNANASVFNTSNPFVQNQPPYHTLQYDGNVSGALGKKASFFFSFDRRNIQANNIVNANVPYVPDPATCEPVSGALVNTIGTPCSLAVPYPQTRTDISPRIDYQLTPNQTLTVRYSYYQDTRTNSGVGSFVLPSQGYNTNEVENRIQISDSQVYGAKFVNNTRFQYVRDQTDQTPQLVAPAINVLQNFQGGGSPLGAIHDTETRYEFQNYASLALTKHYLRFGGRLRDIQDTNYSNANFEGTYTYSNLIDYQVNKPSQFSITTGTPTQSVGVVDLGLYAEDDWKVRPNFTLSYGLRFETQNHIPNKFNFGPRVALSYGFGPSGKPPKTVLRAGYGIFFDRYTYDLLLNVDRYNLNQQGQVQTIQPNPNGTPPNSTTQESVGLPTYYRTQPGLNAPATIETGTGIEHQVNKSVSVSATYLYSRGIHQLLSRNIDAPMPDGSRPALGLCPANPIGAAPGTPCNIYEYDSLAVFKENQVFLNLNVAYGRKLTFTGFYIYSKANGDTGGTGYHPSNQYDIMQDYGRQFFDVRNRVFAFANYSAPWGFRISPFLSAWSGAPFNVQLSQDNNGDSFFNDRPVFASSASNPADVDTTKYGNFDISATPPAGSRIIPINYGNAACSIRHEYAGGQDLWRRPSGGRRQGSKGWRWWSWRRRWGAHAGNGAGRQWTQSGWPEHPCGPALQHHVQRLCPQHLQRGQSRATQRNPWRAAGRHHRLSLFRQGHSAGDRLFLPRLRGAGFQFSGDLQLLGRVFSSESERSVVAGGDFLSRAARWMGQRTAGPSTTPRSGRDDKIVELA